MKITGKILDSTNQPLYLANITIINGQYATKKGAIAKEDGSFDLDADFIEPNSQFKISYQGFKPQVFKASELQGKTIKLQEDVTELEEVVISPRNKPKDIILSQSSNIKQHFEKHKLVYAGLGGLLALGLILISIKKLK